MLTPPGHWIIASRPIGSLKGVTHTSAPDARALIIAASRSLTRYPVRSDPNGNGMGVLKPKTEIMPTGVMTNCERVWLDVGVTVTKPCFEVLPPKVALKLVTNPSKSSGET